jgi:hypothetical protein
MENQGTLEEENDSIFDRLKAKFYQKKCKYAEKFADDESLT